MGTVLVTGSSGQVGSAVVPALRAAGWSVATFDIVDGCDVRDEALVRDAMQGCDAVVHCAALAHDTAGTPAEIMATNVLGTWHVLLAAEAVTARRVVVFSSAQVFGFAEGEGEPLYLPVDDDHPLRAARPYGLSKRLVEDMSEAWTRRTGIATVVLRPVMILTDATLATTKASDAELGAFVHVDDVATAVVRSLDADVDASVDGHVRLTLCGPGEFDASAAARVIGWRATRSWPA